MQTVLWINVRDKLCFLSTLMKFLAGDETTIIFEGNLSNCDFKGINILMPSEHPSLPSGQQRICLILTEDSVKPILRQIQPKGRFVHEIEQIAILVQEKAQVVIADNFHNECISVYELIPIELLDKMRTSKVIRSIMTQEDVEKKYRR